MKINKLYIKAFGKLKDYTLEFADGLNVIYGDNEDGKSTVMSFIRMMFYGSGRSSNQIAKNPRAKYAPWSGDAMGGRIYFEHDGRRYCLEREFRKSDSTDKVTLLDLDLGSSVSTDPAVGAQFFGLSAAAFERSVFIGQAGAFARDDDANGELNARLSNIVLTGDEDTSYHTVFNRLDTARQKLMSKSRRAGLYDKGLAQLEDLKITLKDSDECEQRKNKLNEQIEKCKAELTVLLNEYEATKKTVESENDLRSAAKLKEYLARKAELDQLNETLRMNDGSLIDEMFVRKINFCLTKLENAAQRVNERSEEAETLKNAIILAENADSAETRNEQQQLKQSVEALNRQKISLAEQMNEQEKLLSAAQRHRGEAENLKKPFHAVLLSVGTGFTVIGIALMLLLSQLIIGGAVTGIGIVLLILSFIFRPQDTAAAERADREIAQNETALTEIKQNRANLETRLQTQTERLLALTAALDTDKAVLEQKKVSYAEMIARLSEEQQKADEAQNELFTLFQRYKATQSVDSIRSALKEMEQSAENQKQLKLKLKYISDDLGGISYEIAQQKLNEISTEALPDDTDFENAKAKLQLLDEKIALSKAALLEAATELKTSFRDVKNPSVIANEIKALEERLRTQKRFCDAAEIAQKVLEESFIEVRRSYGSALEKKAIAIFSRLTGNRYGAMNISKSLEITVEETENFGTRVIDYLSDGTADQAYLSMRLALSSLISENNPLPVFLDDVFAQYDDTRTKIAVQFLQEYAKDVQTVLFTCHRFISDTAKTTDAVVTEL